jgi:hypothetical protein|tara:strand:+ start:22 stop:717 length:696 start_codon:yes stop_codon:yes gene_type:complete
MIKKTFLIILLLLGIIFIFNKQILSKYYEHKFSKWVEREVIFNQFNFDYPNNISIKGIKVLNTDPINFENIFEADKVEININLKSLFFSNLVVINSLDIIRPIFNIEIVEKNLKIFNSEDGLTGKEVTYDDNIGIAKKINGNLPSKIWPEKKEDINFLILKSTISEGNTYLKVSSINNVFKVSMSDMKFNKFGNKKNYQHYKEVLKIVLYDIYARVDNSNLKNLLKKIYGL